jgi:hypothetical protein
MCLEGFRPLPGCFTPGKVPVYIMQEDVSAPGTLRAGMEYLASNGSRTPDRPDRSDSLYRLRYPGPLRTQTWHILCNLLSVTINEENENNVIIYGLRSRSSSL